MLAFFMLIFAAMTGISLKDYHFDLPKERIAEFPLKQRDASKLLVYNRGEIQHSTFSQIESFLPDSSLLVFNTTKVIPARILVYRSTGAQIELLLLEPANQMPVEQVMGSDKGTEWVAMIGGLKKWKDDELLYASHEGLEVQAKLIDRVKGIVSINWNNSLSFSEVLQELGKMPLPPYIKRETEESDKERYQTVYALKEGAVAAPTAGLHFTDDILESLISKGHSKMNLTLHVGAGTFQPVKVDDPSQHPMHNERVILHKAEIQKLLECKGRIIPVGTTSMRTLESLYWWGVKLQANPEASFFVDKLFPYQNESIPLDQALQNVLRYMDTRQLTEISGQTEILIMPGYTFQVCKGLITNFHLPETTLILLVAAFIGEDWRKVYDQALNNEYRFLSFGDSSLLIP